MELAKKLLEKAGFDAATISAAFAETPPEDFKVDDALSAWSTNYKKAISVDVKAELKAEFDKEKEQAVKSGQLAVENSIKSQLKKRLNLESIGNVKDLARNDFFDAVVKGVTDTSQSTDEKTAALIKQLEEDRNTVIREKGEYERQVSELTAKVEGIPGMIQQVRVDYDKEVKINSRINQSLNKVEWIETDPKRLAFLKESVKSAVMNRVKANYRETETGFDVEPLNKKGEPIKKPNNAGVYGNIGEYITDFVTENNYTKKSNSGESSYANYSGKIVEAPKDEKGNTKVVDRSRSAELRKRMGK